MEEKELEAEEIAPFLKHFTEIYQDGDEVNPIPKDEKVTIFIDDNREVSGFITNTLLKDAGWYVLVAKRWILESELQKLYSESK